jgi:hypothetical protein
MKRLIVIIFSMICLVIYGQVIRAGYKVVVKDYNTLDVIFKSDSAKKVKECGDTLVVELINGKKKIFYPKQDYVYSKEISSVRYAEKN